MPCVFWDYLLGRVHDNNRIPGHVACRKTEKHGTSNWHSEHRTMEQIQYLVRDAS